MVFLGALDVLGVGDGWCVVVVLGGCVGFGLCNHLSRCLVQFVSSTNHCID